MIELGKKQILTVKRIKTFGVYLGCDGADQAVLLPAKYVPEGSGIGDEIEVFVYRDSQDRLVATTLEPKLRLGETAVLEVKEVGKIEHSLTGDLRRIFSFLSKSRHGARRADRVAWLHYILTRAIDFVQR